MSAERLEELARILLDSEDPAGRTLLADALARAYDGQGLKELRFEHAYLHEQNAAEVLRHLLKRSDALHTHTVLCVDCGRTATFEGGQVEGSRAARALKWHDHVEALNDCGTLCPTCTAQWPGLHGFES
ncbi:hypothetical protein ACF1BP_23535 [Streptomyces sp. NPDC014735]|uniref:hypothetical protein n=1 Tax=Streptomyces sp. NPDC014735 TaxID=3364887 RepID=UPI0036FEB47C